MVARSNIRRTPKTIMSAELIPDVSSAPEGLSLMGGCSWRVWSVEKSVGGCSFVVCFLGETVARSVRMASATDVTGSVGMVSATDVVCLIEPGFLD